MVRSVQNNGCLADRKCQASDVNCPAGRGRRGIPPRRDGMQHVRTVSPEAQVRSHSRTIIVLAHQHGASSKSARMVDLRD